MTTHTRRLLTRWWFVAIAVWTAALGAATGGGTRASQPAAVISPKERWPRVYLSDAFLAGRVRSALDEASRVLAGDQCRLLLTEFRDDRQRLLQDHLVRLNLDIHAYLSFVIFVDSDRSCANTLMYTAPFSRVVWVCSGNAERIAAASHWRFTRSVIHEVLHTLGLGQDPPTQDEIDSRIERSCAQDQRTTPTAGRRHRS